MQNHHHQIYTYPPIHLNHSWICTVPTAVTVVTLPYTGSNDRGQHMLGTDAIRVSGCGVEEHGAETTGCSQRCPDQCFLARWTSENHLWSFRNSPLLTPIPQPPCLMGKSLCGHLLFRKEPKGFVCAPAVKTSESAACNTIQLTGTLQFPCLVLPRPTESGTEPSWR